MSASSDPQPPQRVCPRCSTIARTTEAHCPFCGRSYRRRSRRFGTAALVLTTALATVAATLAGVAIMLSAFGDQLDDELDDQVDVVQRDLDRDIRRLERNIERELDERFPATAGG